MPVGKQRRLNFFINLGGSFIFGILFLLVAAVSVSNFYFRGSPEYIPGAGPYKMLVVLSDSMKPVFAAGDVIIVDTSIGGRCAEGDIITFWRSKNPPVLLTHRVTGIEEAAGREYYNTRGDANNTDDGVAVRQEEILGKYLFKIPFGGYLVNLVHTRAGFVLLIVTPLLLAGGYELRRHILKKVWKAAGLAGRRQI